MTLANEFGSFVKNARERQGMTQMGLAQATGFSLRWIQGVESGIAPSVRGLNSLSEALRLSQWESGYLYLLVHRPPPVTITSAPPADVSDYLESLNPNPAAFLTPAWTVINANSEFTRLFKGLWISPNFLYWHYIGRRTPEIILDWQSSSDWLMAWLRLNMALTPDDPDLIETIEKLLKIRAFVEQWESNVIPVDPSARQWTVRDVDNATVLNIDMRVWRAGLSSSIMLLGSIRERVLA
ncbi:helix-turn-helix domain-containing protein [Mycobacteroides franklinii]|uniref:helix-turn-helix domain-containing protein n=1 Tax=Mycobacteroides franklinii TaxID=948102 RepID=UPI000993DFA2|nr:helix-turn-helix domain-containing protein [Mycobacteroides franklinii]